jgi:hypothetical protein
VEVVLSVDLPDLRGELEAISQLAVEERVAPLARIGMRVAESKIGGDLRDRVVEALVAMIESGAGTGPQRLEAGEALGWLGDPRLKTPAQPGYWATAETEDGPIEIGRFPVTNQEFQAFVQAGGYTNRENWSEEGWEWLQRAADPWPKRSQSPDAKPFVVPNQPVVGVTWWEAEAYARANGARLPRFDERLQIVRGPEKRPYPWGSPFGEGHANTREEVLGRPCAVGLFLGDVTPEGVRDLAGNVAEWAGDGVADQRWYAPGAWDQPSMAAWAKARELERPEARWTGLGFRIARDV